MYPHIDPIALQIGPLAIHWYGLTYLAAFGLFFFLGTRRLGHEPYRSLAAQGVWSRKDVEDILFLGVLAYFFVQTNFRGMTYPRWALRLAVAIIPAPWIAAEMGWLVAEYGRQPWTVDGVLPTALSVSHLSVGDLVITLAGFVILYTVLFVIEMGLMLKYIRKGPVQDVAETEAWMRRHDARLSAKTYQPAE